MGLPSAFLPVNTDDRTVRSMELPISGVYKGSRREISIKATPSLTIEEVRKAVAVVDCGVAIMDRTRWS